MIKLDRWESQLVWLSKGWVTIDADGNDILVKDALKNLWAHRSGLNPEHVEMRFVATALVELVQKVIPNFRLPDFLNDIAPVQYWATKYTDNKGYQERVCWVCLYQYLSNLQIKEKNEKGEWDILVEMEALDYDLFIDEREKEE